jgi:CRP/FNR family transcriptional regulator, cyclic AMP receptor protein
MPRSRADRSRPLGEVELFRRCTPKELDRLAEITEEMDVPAGRVLCEQGRVADRCFIIVHGEADVTVGERHVATVGAGQAVGEMGLLDRLPRSATVTARTPMQVCVIEAARFDQLLDDVPAIAKSLLAELSGRIRDLDNERPGRPYAR